MKMNSNISKILITSALALAGSIAHAETKTQVQLQSGTVFKSLSISFLPGQSMLSDQAKKQIRDLDASTNHHLSGGLIKIAAWSDNDHPKKGNLPSMDQKLAKERIQNIEAFLKDAQFSKDFKAFNMAENRNWIGKVFYREEAELDASFAKSGKKAPITNEEFKSIKTQGGPSKSVIIFEQVKKS